MDNLPPTTDAELARKALRGDSGAFHRLVDRHLGALYGLAAALVGPDAAEDVVQETLAGAYRGLRAFRHEASVKTWLTQILVRQAAAHRRGRLRHRVLPLEGQDEPAVRGTSPQDRADMRMDIDAALRQLSDEHREVIVLRELQGMSYDEIAAVLKVPQGTVESRLHRARRELQEILKDQL